MKLSLYKIIWYLMSISTDFVNLLSYLDTGGKLNKGLPNENIWAAPCEF